MRSAILLGNTPNLFLLQYHLNPMTVSSVSFIPDFAFTLSAVECRKPLAATARRAGWVGCNILLSRIPSDARIFLVKDSRAVPADVARRAFHKLKPLASLKAEKRGWTLDVLNVVRSLNKSEFNLAEAKRCRKER
jgi:type II restriction enzyme